MNPHITPGRTLFFTGSVFIILFTALLFHRSVRVDKAAERPIFDNIQITRNVIYYRKNEYKLAVDIYRPKDIKKPTPALIFIHGGAWHAGFRGDCYPLPEQFSHEGFICFCPDYRLVSKGKNQFPTPLKDLQYCVRWIRSNADKYGVDSSRIAAVGVSSGGHLAAFLGVIDITHSEQIPLNDYSSKVQCVVAISSPLDLTVDLKTDVEKVGQNFQVAVDQLIGSSHDCDSEKSKAASPIFFINKDSSPFLLIHGATDSLVPPDQSSRFYQVLLSNGVFSMYYQFPNEGHQFSTLGFLERTRLIRLFLNNQFKIKSEDS